MANRPWGGIGWNRGFRTGPRSRPADLVIPNLPEAKARHRVHVLNGRVWVVNGTAANTTKTWSWTPGETSWRVENDCPSGYASWTQQSGSFATIAGTIVCNSSVDGVSQVGNACVFDTATRTWTVGAAFAGALQPIFTTTIYSPIEDLYVGGVGTTTNNKQMLAWNRLNGDNGFYALQPSAMTGNTWSGVAIPAADSLDRPYLLEGQGIGGCKFVGSLAGYWQAIAPFGTFRFTFSAVGQYGYSNWIICGGNNGGAGETDKAGTFDSITGVWTELGVQMTIPRSVHSAESLLDGRIVIAGGLTTGAVPTAKAEIFDPGFDPILNPLFLPGFETFTAIADMPEPHYEAQMFSLNGYPVIVGGNTDKVRLYNPQKNTWSNSLADPNS